MFIILILFLNTIIAIIVSGALIHWQPDEWLDSYGLAFMVSFVAWPLFLIIAVGYFIIHNLGKFGLLVAGFLDKIFERKENDVSILETERDYWEKSNATPLERRTVHNIDIRELTTDTNVGTIINRYEVIEHLRSIISATNTNNSYNEGFVDGLEFCISTLATMPSSQPEQPEIIRCKDCKHKPYPSDNYDYDNSDCGFEIIFPDYRCPCRCEDEYYNRIPDDDWFCGNAERRTDE